MGSVDKADQCLEPYSSERKTLAWFKKLGLHFMFRMLLNSFVLFSAQQTNRGIRYRQHFLDFTMSVAEQIISKYSPGGKKMMDDQQHGGIPPFQLKAGAPVHALLKIPKKPGRKKITQKVCRQCSFEGRERKDTTTWCPPCQAGLCSILCYEAYHLRSPSERLKRNIKKKTATKKTAAHSSGSDTSAPVLGLPPLPPTARDSTPEPVLPDARV